MRSYGESFLWTHILWRRANDQANRISTILSLLILVRKVVIYAHGYDEYTENGFPLKCRNHTQKLESQKSVSQTS